MANDAEKTQKEIGDFFAAEIAKDIFDVEEDLNDIVNTFKPNLSAIKIPNPAESDDEKDDDDANPLG